MKRLLTRERDERGASAVMIAILSIVIFGSAALAVDITTLGMERQKLHDHVDSAAHAGAYSLPANGEEARNAALAMARAQDGDARPSAKLFCIVASTGGSMPDIRGDQIPSNCDPGRPGAPYTKSRFPGTACNAKICAIPCPATRDAQCNTVEVTGNKTVDFGFASLIGFSEGDTGAVATAACKGACGEDVPNPLDIVIMADRTASMIPSDRAMMKSAILNMAQTMTPDLHHVAFGALHKSKTSGFRHRNSLGSASTAGWTGVGDTDGDGYCRSEAVRTGSSSAASTANNGTWIAAPFTNDYLLADGSINPRSKFVDAVSCLPESTRGEYGTHLAGAMKGAARALAAGSTVPGASSRPGTPRKVIIFETDGMPDEVDGPSPESALSLTNDNYIGAGTQGSSRFAGENGCKNFEKVAQRAKDQGIIVITIGFGGAATGGCRRTGETTSSGRPVREVLANAATPVDGVAAVAGDCTTTRGQIDENSDGDYFFCSTSGSDLAEIFRTAINQVSTGIKLVKIPK